MAEALRELSVTALERMLARKRTQLETLRRRRHTLTQQLAKVDRQIKQLGGGNGTGRESRRRPRNRKPLLTVVVDLLKKHKGGLALSELAAKIVASGYKSNSSDFKSVVYQCLYHNRKTIVHDEQAGVYKLHKPPAAPGKAQT